MFLLWEYWVELDLNLLQWNSVVFGLYFQLGTAGVFQASPTDIIPNVSHEIIQTKTLKEHKIFYEKIKY